jgi:hypothetical protein
MLGLGLGLGLMRFPAGWRARSTNPKGEFVLARGTRQDL